MLLENACCCVQPKDVAVEGTYELLLLQAYVSKILLLKAYLKYFFCRHTIGAALANPCGCRWSEGAAGEKEIDKSTEHPALVFIQGLL